MQLQGYPVIAIEFRDDENEVQHIHTVFADDHGIMLVYDFNWTPARTCYRYEMSGYGGEPYAWHPYWAADGIHVKEMNRAAVRLDEMPEGTEEAIRDAASPDQWATWHEADELRAGY